MQFEALNLPVWKTRGYSFEIAKLQGAYRIYLKRLGKYYMRNENGVKLRFITDVPDEIEYYDLAYKNQTPIIAVYQ